MIVGSLCALGGCLDAESMIASREKAVQLARMEEVDLGSFHVSLPNLPNKSASALVQFHAFGQVPNSETKAVTASVEEHSSELRHRMLLAVRELNLDELEEASLDTLRQNIEQVVKETIPGDAIQSVGFYRFSLITQ